MMKMTMRSISLSILFVFTCLTPSLSVTYEVEYLDYEVLPEWEIINKYTNDHNMSELECQNAIRGVNHNQYITPKERYTECQRRVMYNVLDDRECYVDQYVDNPCEIKCFTMSDKSDRCLASVERVRMFRFIGKQCGPEHTCNKFGCCERKGTTTGTTITEPPVASTPTTIHTTEEPQTNPSTNPTTISVAPTEAEQFVCPRTGDFRDDKDISAYWHCYYALEVLECQENEIFDKWNEKCVFDWYKYIRCTKEGYFKNPYDCHKFYWCHNGTSDLGHLNADFFTCANDVNSHPMVWNDKEVSCVSNQNDTVQCDEQPLPTDSKDIPNDSLLETDVEFRIIYERNIECQSVGRFRNPFDCHKYYRCYYSDNTDVLLNIEFYKCKDELMVFDTKSGKCLDESRTTQCINDQIPGQRKGDLQSYDHLFIEEM